MIGRHSQSQGDDLHKDQFEEVKEADLYSAFIEVPYTQGLCLQTTPYLPLPRKHSPDGASQAEAADICATICCRPHASILTGLIYWLIYMLNMLWVHGRVL